MEKCHVDKRHSSIQYSIRRESGYYMRTLAYIACPFCNQNSSEFEADAVFTSFHGNGIIAMDACTARAGFVHCIVLED